MHSYRVTAIYTISKEHNKCTLVVAIDTADLFDLFSHRFSLYNFVWIILQYVNHCITSYVCILFRKCCVNIASKNVIATLSVFTCTDMDHDRFIGLQAIKNFAVQKW